MRHDKSKPQPGLGLPVLEKHKGNSLGGALLTFKEIHLIVSCRDPGQ